MEENARTKKIISQAAQWSFKGDCSLLSWMQELSQNLEKRATATSDALQQLSVNVNRTAIALDNAANSLTALQYTQFVESRCHDDDETLANTANLSVEVVTTPTNKPKTPNEVLETFLRKNLQMLHNSHEKYSLDFEDSDDDEGATTNNCIYQPKNPYNDALLPHIYGSKLWKEHWHVGLCDGSNEYSGDEASDAFSISSSSSAADNESYESNTANLSEWASSTSIPIEHKHPAQLAAANGTAVPAPANPAAHNARLPISPLFSRNDDSDTCSTTSRSTTTNPPTRQTGGEHDLFAALRHDTPITSSSASSSSPQQQPQVAASVQSQRNAAQAPLMCPPFYDTTPPTDIFDDAAQPRQSIGNRTSDPEEQRPAVSQSRAKPVNLFDDDDFHSFMTEVEDKPQTKVDQPQQLPVPATRNLPTKNEAGFIAKETAKPKPIDLFTETSTIKTPMPMKSAAVEIQKPKENKQRKPINLFDSPESSPPNDSLFSSAITSEKKVAGVVKPPTMPSINAKSLFDDDEDDDDFLNVFGAKKLSTPQRSIGKNLLFDDDKEENSESTKEPARLTNNLFDDTPPADEEVKSTATFEKRETKKSTESGSIIENVRASSQTAKVDIFDNFEDKIAKPKQTLEPSTVKPNNKLFAGDLFGDEDNDELDDLFKKQRPSQQSTKSAASAPIAKVSDSIEPAKSYTKEIIQKRKPLFGNEFEDDEDDLFSDRSAKREDEKAANKVSDSNKGTMAKPPKIDVPNKPPQVADVPAKNVYRNISLFADDFDDEADDLFGIKPTAKQIPNEENSTDHTEIKDSINNLFEQEKDNKTQLNQAAATVVLKTKQIPVKEVPKLEADMKQKIPPVFEDEMKNEATDLFNKVNKDLQTNVTKNKHKTKNEASLDARLSDNTIHSVVQKPENYFFEQTETPAIDENVSNAAATAKEISNDKRLLEETDDDLVIEQNSKISKTSSKEKLTDHEEKADTLESATKSSIFEFDGESSLETSIHSATKKDTIPLSLPIESDARNNEYPSIFLDEPPDDDDFFTTLSSNTQPLSVSKLTLDLESDFYEPALPAPPNLAKTVTSLAATNSQLDGNNKQQSNSSDYGGLRLFSEIPPDDDCDDFSFTAPTKYTAENVGANQRLHSVFYDDFSETLEAVQQIKEKQIKPHALFDDEPPPDEEQFDIMKKVVEKRQQANRTEVVENITTPAHNDFESDGGDNTEKSGFTAPSKDDIDRAAPKVDSESDAAAVKQRAPVAGKLQIPNIKINVQALLPGGGGRPNFKKTATTPSVSIQAAASTEEMRVERSRLASNLNASAELANENILPSVCKTRVRAPVGRRPSTRRARQENYRQSLIAEQADFGEQTNAPCSSLNEQPKKEQINIIKTREYASKETVEKMSTQTLASSNETSNAFKPSSSRLNANLFENDDDDIDNDSLFSSAFNPTASRNIPGQSAVVNAPKPKADHITTEQPITQTRPVQAATVKGRPIVTKDFAVKCDDEADDLFKSGVHAAPMRPAETVGKTTTKPSNFMAAINASKSLFGTPPSEDSDDDLFKSNKLASAVKAKTKPLTTKTTTSSVSDQPKTIVTTTTTTKTASVVGGKLDSIFGSDDEDDDFLSNLKPKKKSNNNKTHIPSRQRR